MERPILNLDGMPTDAIEKLIWLGGVMEQVKRELDLQWRKAYFDARFTGRFDEALALGFHPRKPALAYTRAENESRGRMIRWGDGRSH